MSVLKMHRLSQDDVTALIELDLKQLKTHLDATSRHLRSHANDLGPDADLWLTDFREQCDAFKESLTLMECESCERLATWLHPDCNERYCAEHAADFLQCDMCGQWMHLGDSVSDASGTNTGHEHCLHPEAEGV